MSLTAGNEGTCLRHPKKRGGCRLLKKVFNWDKRLCKKNWSSEICAICDDLDILDNVNDNLCTNPSLAKNCPFNLYEDAVEKGS